MFPRGVSDARIHGKFHRCISRYAILMDSAHS